MVEYHVALIILLLCILPLRTSTSANDTIIPLALIPLNIDLFYIKLINN